MFYLHLLVNKRGPLAKIWLAAHWEKKLTKAHVFECNLEIAVAKIISPKFTIALRTSGHLLVGVVRIYHRKAKYLLSDCSEALTKIKTTFRPGLIDLPEHGTEAAFQSITLPEEFHDFEGPLPDVSAIDVAEYFALNQSRVEDITLKEDYDSKILLCDRNFGERGREIRNILYEEAVENPSCSHCSNNSLGADLTLASASGCKFAYLEDTHCFEHDGFGDEDNDIDMIEMLLQDEQNVVEKDIPEMEEECPLFQALPEISMASEFAVFEPSCADTTAGPRMDEVMPVLKEEGFVLEPVDDPAVTQGKKKKRKRKLLVDVDKELNYSTIYNQLNNYTDLLTTLDLAPPTKKTMMWKKSGGVENLLCQATQPVVHAELQMLFARCFKSRDLKMSRDGRQGEPAVEKKREEQDIRVEEPSYLQESAHSETQRKIRNDSFKLTSQSSRVESDDNFGEAIVSSFHMFQRPECILWCHFFLCQGSISNPLQNHWQVFEKDAGASDRAPRGLSPTGFPVGFWLLSILPSGWVTSFYTHTLLFPFKELKRSEESSEELKWNKRIHQLLRTLQQLKSSGTQCFSLQELCRTSSRREAAATFYSLLVLQQQSVLELYQSRPFADITATAGPAFSSH
ncbi:RD21L protein, partial [Urocolius indicus]|nr:RD21L protein [Urocolius indicus]